MLHFGICDDNEKHRNQIYELVCKTIFKHDEAEFSYYSTGQEVIDEIIQDKFFCDLLFLDINMPLRDGLETANYIRQNQIDVDIIFITVSKEHVFDGYTYQAFSYLLKPLDNRRLEDELERYIVQRNSVSNCLHISINGHKRQIFLEKVLYFASEGRKICIHQKGEEDIWFYSKLSDLETILEKYDYVRCHQSFLVNSKYIQSFSGTEIMVAGTILPVSRRYGMHVKQFMERRKGGI